MNGAAFQWRRILKPWGLATAKLALERREGREARTCLRNSSTGPDSVSVWSKEGPRRDFRAGRHEDPRSLCQP
jgi:hypothetical protein